MSKIKSISVGYGDMVYINHGSDNFSIIDCCMDEETREDIVNELISESKNKGIKRFISTHPDDDHIQGIEYLDDRDPIVNFYCVKNEAIKPIDTKDFRRYCELRDSTKAFYLYRDCTRKWMNISDDERGSAGIDILWPITENDSYKDALEKANKGISYNNISPIIRYSLNEGVSVIWMGDLETDLMDLVKDEISLPKTDILFAPHHGRNSGKVPSKWLDDMKPKVIIIGEAPSKDLNYYQGYDTITQNTAGDIILDCDESQKVHFYVTNADYEVDFLIDERKNKYNYYLGTLLL